jgi:hypothetical protein
MYQPTAGGDGAWRINDGAAPGQDVTALVHDRRWLWVASRDGVARWPLANLP